MIHGGNVSKDPPQTSVPPSTWLVDSFIHYFIGDWLIHYSIIRSNSTFGRHSSTNNTTTMIQAAEEESEAEVRRVDQDNINKFARLNARLHELRDERDLLKVRNHLPPQLFLTAMVAEEHVADSGFRAAPADETTGPIANFWICTPMIREFWCWWCLQERRLPQSRVIAYNLISITLTVILLLFIL